ncbi:hypothetical protein [Cohnella mopanensis]|uniref:hypothetical protein n=1 Tax=Cohnella mopanensis TaxID=2911966 RepID=UPI001EF7F818|nr:hypothetical protein [Cohnella mopanensis]
MQQRESATGQRLEMLNRDLTGTKKLLEVVVWAVLKSFEGVTLEYEMVSSTGVKAYIDVHYAPLDVAFECDGFVAHSEKITRDRFDFEKTRVRTMALIGLTYKPYSKDQLDKQPDACRRSFFELIGQRSSLAGSLAMEQLSVYEREVIRYALQLMRPLRISDVNYTLQCKYDLSHKVIYQLINKRLLKPIGTGSKRYHEYILLPLAKEYLVQRNRI